jgi:ferredoxin
MIEANQLKKLSKKPYVNASCIGCGACAAICGDVFELDAEGISKAVTLETYPEAEVDDAISACPVAAISWQDADSENSAAK